MLIKEVCLLTGLTKKAVSYYEKQGLIEVVKGNNGYREYSKENIRLLYEISLYRKLDISIKDIKIIINSKHKKSAVNKIIKEKQDKEIQIKKEKIYLEKVLNSNFNENFIREITKEIIEAENNNGEFIKKELVRVFPDGMGLYLAHHFAPYLNEPIDTEEKHKAWIEIIEFLDNVPDIKIPKIIQAGYENINEEIVKHINENMKNEINNMLNAEGAELEMYKKKLLDNIEKQNDKSILKVINPINKFKKQLNDFFNSSGYYDIFIHNLKILSSEYKDYYDKLTKLNDKMYKELGIKYDENMRVIVSKDNR